MTESQREAFHHLVCCLNPAEFHHGSCMGSDVEAARMVRRLAPRCLIVAHPGPDGDPCRTLSHVDDDSRPPKTHFARNRDIVDECDQMIATPPTAEPQQRGGTWYTVGYAAKRNKPCEVIPPDVVNKPFSCV